MLSPAPAAEETTQQAIDRLWETVPWVWNQIRANVRAIASERYGISVQQFRVLRHIRRGVHSASALASACQTSRPAISQCVDALVAKGLITRRQSSRDRRYVELALTPGGSEMLDAIFDENRRWMRQKLASQSSEEIRDILVGMQVLKSAFGA